MDLQSALVRTSETKSANVVGLQIHGRTIEVYRPRFCQQEGRCKVEYRESLLFQNGFECDIYNHEQLPGEALALEYFETSLSEDELDVIFDQRGETLLHRLLDGAPDPKRCQSPREKAAFTSWCISTLAQRNS